jgi:hypothetical protein
LIRAWDSGPAIDPPSELVRKAERAKGRIMDYQQQVDEWLRAAAKASKRILSSKRKTREFMIRTGIVAKCGKRLAKAYR